MIDRDGNVLCGFAGSSADAFALLERFEAKLKDNPGNVPRALPGPMGARLDPSTWPMPSIMRVLGALGGIGDAELRATFNAGLGMVVVVPAVAAARTVELARARGVPAWAVGQVAEAQTIGGRYVEEGLTR